MNNETEKLLPCPFCGITPILNGKLGRYTIFHKCAAVQAIVGVGRKLSVIDIWNKRSK